MATPKRPQDGSRETLERMSTAELEELLLLDFRSKENVSDMSGLFRAAEVLASRRVECPPGAGPDRAWEVFQKHYLPFAGDGNSLYYEEAEARSASAPAVQPGRSPDRAELPSAPLRRRTVRSFAGFLFGAVLGVSLLLIFPPEVRADLSGWALEFQGEDFICPYPSPKSTPSSDGARFSHPFRTPERRQRHSRFPGERRLPQSFPDLWSPL